MVLRPVGRSLERSDWGGTGRGGPGQADRLIGRWTRMLASAPRAALDFIVSAAPSPLPSTAPPPLGRDRVVRGEACRDSVRCCALAARDAREYDKRLGSKAG